MKTQLPVKTGEEREGQQEHRVLQFRPRTPPARPRGGTISPQNSSPQNNFPREANDLSAYEQDRPDPDDFRHRMLANAAAFVFTVVLIATGIWLALSIAEMRNTQDCVLMGRRDCARISAAPLPPS